MTYLLAYAISFLNVPYKYGGNNPLDGIDCLAFCLELLRASGEWNKSDASAKMMYDHFKEPKNGTSLQTHRAGALVFYGKGNSISHVDFVLDKFQVIGAIGGTSNPDAGIQVIFTLIVAVFNDYFIASKERIHHD